MSPSCRRGQYRGVVGPARVASLAAPAMARGRGTSRIAPWPIPSSRNAPRRTRLLRGGRSGSGRCRAGTGFAGHQARTRGTERAVADGLASPQRHSHACWPRPLRRWHAGHRQIVEPVVARLLPGHGPERGRPRTRGGLPRRIATRVTLLHVVIARHRAMVRPALALATAIRWYNNVHMGSCPAMLTGQRNARAPAQPPRHQADRGTRGARDCRASCPQRCGPRSGDREDTATPGWCPTLAGGPIVAAAPPVQRVLARGRGALTPQATAYPIRGGLIAGAASGGARRRGISENRTRRRGAPRKSREPPPAAACTTASRHSRRNRPPGMGPGRPLASAR